MIARVHRSFLMLCLVLGACAPIREPLLAGPTQASSPPRPDATPVVLELPVEFKQTPAEPGSDIVAASVTTEPGDDCAQGRCLWTVPHSPKPGELVMYETTAESWATSAVLSAFGRDVHMFRMGDRFRAYVGVPLNAQPTAFSTRLWLTAQNDPDGRLYRCMDTLVSSKSYREAEELHVARRFTRRQAQAAPTPLAAADSTAAWVDPLDRPPFSSTLFLWPRPGNVTSEFGRERSYNKRFSSRHMGLDIEGNIGDRVFATQKGVVRYSGRQRATGQTLVIDHGGGVLSFYMHLSRRLKKIGERVEQGELIGQVGKTGRVTGPHLHFAVSVSGRFVDPEQVLTHPLYAETPGEPCRTEPSTHSVR